MQAEETTIESNPNVIIKQTPIAEVANIPFIENKSGLEKLPKRELEISFDFYKKSVAHLKDLVEAIDSSISSMNGSGGKILSYLLGYNRIKYLKAKMLCERDEATAKISVQEYHIEVYADRIQEYTPIFEERAKECNENFEDTWASAVLLAKRMPLSPLADILKRYDGAKKDAGLDEDLKLQLKVELYFSLKFHIENFEKQAKKDFKNPNRAQPIRK